MVGDELGRRIEDRGVSIDCLTVQFDSGGEGSLGLGGLSVECFLISALFVELRFERCEVLLGRDTVVGVDSRTEFG